jgi:phosphoribosylformylglycinamidine synthase
VAKVRVHVTLKAGVLDPQGKAVQAALGRLGFSGVEGVRQGKYLEIELAESDPDKAHAQVADMCRQLLANTVIEDFAIDVGE